MKLEFKSWLLQPLLPPLLAVQFLTRVPLPWLNAIPADLVKDNLAKTPIWFGFVGGLIGLCTAVIYFALSHFFPAPLAIVIALALEILISGAFHEDAFADFCDGFGGGLTPERVHEIMKDSRIGTYGTTGLFFALAIRVVATISIPPEHLLAALIFSESLSRVVPIIIMMYVPPANFSVKISKDIESEHNWGDVAKALTYSLPFWVWGIWLLSLKALGLLVAISVFLFWLSGFLKRKLGGRNGDCLGAGVYVVKIFCLLAFCIK